MVNSKSAKPKRPITNGPMVPDSVYQRKRTIPNGPMVPDSVYPDNRRSPFGNLQPTMKNHFISIAKPPKTMLMERYNPDTSNRISPIVPSSQFHEEDAEFTKSEKPLPEGVYVGKLGRDKYGNLSQRVASPVFTDFDRYINTKHTDYGPYESEGHWGIYDTDFKGGRRKKRKNKKTQKTKRKHKTHKKRVRKTRKSRKNVKSNYKKH